LTNLKNEETEKGIRKQLTSSEMLLRISDSIALARRAAPSSPSKLDNRVFEEPAIGHFAKTIIDPLTESIGVFPVYYTLVK